MFANICYDYVKDCSNDFLLLLYLMFKDDCSYEPVCRLIKKHLEENGKEIK